MRYEDIDQKIGMPDIDLEWKKFEAETIERRSITPRRRRMLSRAASIALLCGIGLTAVAATLFVIQTSGIHEDTIETPPVIESAEASEAEVTATDMAGFNLDALIQEFDNAQLQTLTAYLQQRYGIEPVFVNDEARYVRLYVTLEKEMLLTDVVDLLNNLQNVQFRIIGNQLIIE